MAIRTPVRALCRIAACAFFTLFAASGMFACAGPPSEGASGDGVSAQISDAREDSPTTSGPDQSRPSVAVRYPIGWLVKDAGGIPSETPIQILSVPDITIVGHRNGKPIGNDEQERQRTSWPSAADGEALVEYDGRIAAVPADWLLVNLSDIMPDAEYDIAYSYASTSRCAGQPISGVTDERLPGYAKGKQDNPYLAELQFLVPCAYRTALKAQMVNAALEDQGMRLLVFDAYRPMSAQLYLSNAFEATFWNDTIMQESLGAWSLDWFVANGPSGHNYGTDLDVGVCDLQGDPIAMPSPFDAFDESGHLTQWPMAADDITPKAYRNAVLSNEACVALHAAFTQVGFSELASEWWHFADNETEAAMREIVGSGGLDFIA